MKKILIIVGTRPEAIKMAPVILEFQKYPQKFQSIVVSTGQHKQMLQQVFDLFEIKPDYELRVMLPNQTLSQISVRIINKLGTVFETEKPDLVLVHGDTPTACIASLVAYYYKIPLGHVEAGLRTYNKYNPFPEEVDRQVIDVIADLLLAPTKQSEQNLLQENKDKHKIFVTGNTVIDALLTVAEKEYQFKDKTLRQLETSKRVILLTAHRRESWGTKMEGFLKAINDVVSEYDDLLVVYPVHLNPLVQTVAKKVFKNNKNAVLVDPLDYPDMVKLMKQSYMVLTDSGGIQEEAPSLGKPTLVLRDTTERPEGIQAGTLALIGTEYDSVYKGFKGLLEDIPKYKAMARAKNPYGDGKAASRIVTIVSEYLN